MVHAVIAQILRKLHLMAQLVRQTYADQGRFITLMEGVQTAMNIKELNETTFNVLQIYATNNSLFNLTELAKTVHNSPNSLLILSDANLTYALKIRSLRVMEPAKNALLLKDYKVKRYVDQIPVRTNKSLSLTVHVKIAHR